ncbi:MAG: hypothetical protein NC434_07905 [Ruminococcus sp.]|nr:hypothetical protein [Ruminococcus sp.]
MNDTIDILCMLCGAYLLYTGLVMKVQGKIVGYVVLRKNTDENSIRDKEGFVRYLYLKLILIGVIIMITAIISLFDSYMGLPKITSALTGIVFLAAIIAYAVFVNKALKKYCN